MEDLTYSELLKHPELYSEVINALEAGYSESSIAKETGLSLELVLEVRRKHNESVKKQEQYKGGRNLDNILSDLIKQNTLALNNVAKLAHDPSYVINQKAGDLGTLYEKIGNFTIRLLEAAAEAQRKSDQKDAD